VSRNLKGSYANTIILFGNVANLEYFKAKITNQYGFSKKLTAD